MKTILKAVLTALLAVSCVMLAACGGGGEVEPTKKPIPTPTPAPTIVPSITALGEDGYFEDTYITAYFPKYLEYDYSPAYNCACYTHKFDDENVIAMMYLPDEYCFYDEEFDGHDFASYSSVVYNMWGARLDSFKYTEVDGREALRTVISYESEAGDKTIMLSYMINIEGWTLTVSFNTTLDEIPEECERSILGIKIK